MDSELTERVITALEYAQRALNEIPNTKLTGECGSSYDVAHLVDIVLSEAKMATNHPTKTDTVKMPTWALPYLINADSSGLTEDEEAMIDQWVKRYNQPTFECSEDTYFAPYPAFGLASSVVDCNVWEHIYK